MAPGAPKETVLFSLSDYMGLSDHPQVRAAVAEAAARVGNGPRSSALVTGHTTLHRALELELASLKGTEDCLLFPSGFQANLSVATTLASPRTTIFSDELNHASIIDGLRLARSKGATVKVFRHNDLAHLEELVRRDIEEERQEREGRSVGLAPATAAGATGAAAGPATATPSGGRLRAVIADSLFSMDGDFAPMRGFARLRREYGLLLVLDEAHATLCCGARGAGGAERAGLAGGDVDLHVGTLSKAVGSTGGFVACSTAWRDALANLGRAHVFSTAATVPTVAGALAAVRAARDEPWRRERLWSHARALGRALGRLPDSYIVPIVLGDERTALDASVRCLARGVGVPAIRPPTVPRGTARLRISFSAAHEEGEVGKLIAVLAELGIARRIDRLADVGRVGAAGADIADEADEADARSKDPPVFQSLLRQIDAVTPDNDGGEEERTQERICAARGSDSRL